MSSKADVKAQKRAKFEHVFNVIREELVEYVKAQGIPQDATGWFTRVRSHLCMLMHVRGD